MRQLLSALGIALAATQAAGAPVFVLPVDCDPGKSCYVQHYVDRASDQTAQDYTCGALTYDGHKGTDFALPSLKDMAQGVNVLAAAPGVVRGLRDGMADNGFSEATAQTIAGKECGNGVVVDHGGGWVSQYCHMKKGSLTVQKGQRIAASTVLGQIGLSGRTQFPHLHLSVRYKDRVIDPFLPDTQVACSAQPPAKTLWKDPLPYRPTGLIDIGFSPQVPQYEAIKRGDGHSPSLSPDSPAIVAWAYAWGGLPGDRIRVVIDGPDGRIVDQVQQQEKFQIQYFRAMGKKRPHSGWPRGRYRATITLVRNSRVMDQRRVEILLD